MRRLMIAGTHSGCGKTTAVCAVLQALVNRKINVASFKCGPDYIDPMFHSRIIGTDSYNLDAFFCNNDTLRCLFTKHGETAELSVIEGVMGFYDGACGKASSYEISETLAVPVVMVIDCKGMSGSIGAVMKGFLTYRQPNRIAGFLFNRLPESLVPEVQKLCVQLGTEFLGFLPFCRDAQIESRHLGLVTAREIADLKQKTQLLAEQAERHIRISRLLELSEAGALPAFSAPVLPLPCPKKQRIAVARDGAFCFLYRDNLDCLRELGCEICFFSPLSDSRLPENCSGLILSGGYPELYARQLSENRNMREEIREKILGGLPTIAECGGFLYLNQALTGADGASYPMAGVFEGTAYQTGRLQRFGYIKLTAKRDNLLCGAGEEIPAHEFHYWDSTDCGADFSAEKANGRSWDCAHGEDALYAGFPHLFFYANPGIAARFVKKCMEYGEKHDKN